MSDGEEQEAASQLIRKQATAHGSILTWKTEILNAQSVCHSARTNTDFGAKLMAGWHCRRAVGGGGNVLLCKCCSARWCHPLAQTMWCNEFCHGWGGDAAGQNRAFFLETEAALCSCAVLATWVIHCVFLFPKHQPVLLSSVTRCVHTGSVNCFWQQGDGLGFCATSQQ